MSTPGDRWGRDRCHTLSLSSTAFQTEGKLYLILDFLRGGDLFTRLSKEVQAPPGRVGCRRLSRTRGQGEGTKGGMCVCVCTRIVSMCWMCVCECAGYACICECRVCRCAFAGCVHVHSVCVMYVHVLSVRTCAGCARLQGV